MEYPQLNLLTRNSLIIRGDLFSCGEELTIASNETKICQLKTGDVETLFYGFNFTSNCPSLSIFMYEEPTITDGTNLSTPINYNRVSGRAPKFKLFLNPTNVSGGTVVKKFKSYTAPAEKSTTTVEANGTYLYLKPDTDYSIHITNLNNQTHSVFAQFLLAEIN